MSRIRAQAEAGYVSGGSKPCVIEPLEARRLMASAQITDGELVVTGDPAIANALTVSPSDDGRDVVVNVNDVDYTFHTPSITSIRIIGGEQADRILVQPGLSSRVFIYGYGGNDDITTADGNDTVWGGDGEDTINTSGGNDVLYGGNGEDQLDAGAGRNVVQGGEGKDWIRAAKADLIRQDKEDLILMENERVNRLDSAKNLRKLAQWVRGGLGNGKPIFDATFYTGKPDARSMGFTPVYMGYDGSLNRTTTPWGDYAFPTDQNWDAAVAAYKKIARVGAGIDKGFSDHRRPNDIYHDQPEEVVLNLEDPRFAGLDGGADPAHRRDIINKLVSLIGIMKAEQASHGVESPGVSIFYWPPAFWSGHPADPKAVAAMAQAKQDFQPLVDSVKAFYPEVYTHFDDLTLWLKRFRQQIQACRAADPTKPIYPVLAPIYSHWSGSAYLGKPLREQAWRFIVDTVMREADGMMLWGGIDFSDLEDPLPWIPPEFTSADAAKSDTVLPTVPRNDAQPGTRGATARRPVIQQLQDSQNNDTYVLPLRTAPARRATAVDISAT